MSSTRGFYLSPPYDDQDDWGCSPLVPDDTWVPFNPEDYVLPGTNTKGLMPVHWGGVGPYRILTKADLRRLVKGWDGYHRASKAMRMLAYCAVIGPHGWLVRGRGHNQNGAHKRSSWWGDKTYPVCLTWGQNSGYEVPRAMRRRVACLWVEFGGPTIVAHGDLPPAPDGTTQATSCCGPFMRNEWIPNEGWLDELGDRRFGSVNMVNRSLKVRLAELGFLKAKARYGRLFNARLRRAVRDWQGASGLPVTGRMGRDDWKALGDQ